jgi:hypothetical protein
VWLVLGGAPTKYGDTLCVLSLLSGGHRLIGCPRGGSGGKVADRSKASSERVGTMTVTSIDIVTFLKLSLLQLPPPALMLCGNPRSRSPESDNGGTFGVVLHLGTSALVQGMRYVPGS